VPVAPAPFASSFAGTKILTGGFKFTRLARAIFWGRELPQEATGGDDDRDGAGLFRLTGPEDTCGFGGVITEGFSRTSTNDEERPIWPVWLPPATKFDRGALAPFAFGVMPGLAACPSSREIDLLEDDQIAFVNLAFQAELIKDPEPDNWYWSPKAYQWHNEATPNRAGQLMKDGKSRTLKLLTLQNQRSLITG
jgi:hypothetical protein